MTEKKQNRAKNLATITFVASNEMEVRTIAHLKKVKDKSGVEIKAQILRAVTSLTGLYSIEFEDATVNFIIDLTTHLNRGLSYAKNHKHQIQLPPSSWTQFCQIADSIFPGGSDDLGGKSTIVPIIGDLPKSQDLIVKQDEDEDEDEDYSDLSNEEYMALMQSKTITPQVKN
jgi:hypothetical protein